MHTGLGLFLGQINFAGLFESLTARATSWYDAKDITSATQQTLPNRNGAGTAQRGSTAGSDTNDPVFLPHDGEDYVWVPPPVNTNGNGVQVAVPGIVGPGDVTLEIDISLDALNLAANLAGPVQGFLPYVAGLNLQLWWAPATGGSQFLSFGAHGLSAGERAKFRITRTKSTGVIRAEKSTDGGSSWTNLPTSHTVNVGVDHLGSNTIRWGYGVVAHSAAVRYYGPVIVNGVAVSPQSGTILRDTTGLKTAVVTRPVPVFDGVDDYVQLPASDTPTFTPTTGKHTVVLAFRKHGAADVFERLYSTESSGNVGHSLYLTGGTREVRAFVGDNINNRTRDCGDYTDGAITVVANVVDDGTLYGYMNGQGRTAGTVIAATSLTFQAPRVGSSPPNASVSSDTEIFAALSFPGEALTEAELDTIAAKLIAGSYT